MELRRLRYFVVLGQELNFTRAALSIGIAQPALSQQIKVLEKEVGAHLVERSSRGVRLTDAGETLYEAGQRLLDEVDEVIARVRAIETGSAGHLRVAYSTSIARIGPDLVREFRRLHPGVRISAETGFWTTYNLAQVRSRSVDVAFVPLPPLDGAGIRTLLLGHHEIVALMRANHRLAAQATIDVADLDGVSLGVFPGLVEYASRIASGWTEIHPILAAEEPDPRLLHEAVADNVNLVAILDRPHAEQHRDGVVIRSFTESHRAGYGIAWLPDNRSAVLMQFIDLCQKAADQRV